HRVEGSLERRPIEGSVEDHQDEDAHRNERGERSIREGGRELGSPRPDELLAAMTGEKVPETEEPLQPGQALSARLSEDRFLQSLKLTHLDGFSAGRNDRWLSMDLGASSHRNPTFSRPCATHRVRVW